MIYEIINQNAESLLSKKVLTFYSYIKTIQKDNIVYTKYGRPDPAKVLNLSSERIRQFSFILEGLNIIKILGKRKYIETGITKKEHDLAANIFRNHGLHIQEYNKLSEEQNHCCKICGKHKSNIRHERLYVDHCHTTNKIRGLLCHHCNIGVGMFMDNKDIMLKAIDYLDNN